MQKVVSSSLIARSIFAYLSILNNTNHKKFNRIHEASKVCPCGNALLELAEEIEKTDENYYDDECDHNNSNTSISRMSDAELDSMFKTLE